MSVDLKGQKYLVIGGAGYIGSHVCKMIADHGGLPFTLDNFCSGHKHAVKWGPYEDLDLRDKSATLKALKTHQDASSVIHLASMCNIRANG